MKKGKKRIRQESEWKKNVVKKSRNSGKAYQSPKSGKIVPERSLKPPCKYTFTFKCQINITESQRQQLLAQYWALGDIEKQWTFLANNVETVVPKHVYVKVDAQGCVAPNRENNDAYFLTVSGVKTRVCRDSAHSQIEKEIKRQLRSGPMYTP
uniref:Uncharacterized protein LOC114335366 isoform X1 n=1 Tax=Diabrotica virgifera virgifera TaxID=50390 RepID=A0A6P7FY42_DIAVI